VAQKLPVPSLNLSTLKHVVEYTQHDEVFLNENMEDQEKMLKDPNQVKKP
jgi:hypothetical protein